MNAVRLIQGAGRILQAELLPPVPVDPLGRHVSWAILLSAPGLHYTFDGDTTPTFLPVDEGFVDRQIALYAEMQGAAYTAPVINGHDEAANPHRRGDVLALAKWVDPRDGTLKLLGAVAWADEDAPDKIRTGALKYLSGGWGTLKDEKGREIPGVLRHVGVVSAPHQLNIDGGRGRHLLNQQQQGGSAMDSLTLEGLAERLDALAASQEALVATLAKMDLMGDDGAEEEEEEDEMVPAVLASQTDDAVTLRLAQAEAKVAALEAREARLLFDAAYPEGAVITLSAALRDACFALAQTSPAAFAALAGVATPAAVPVAPTPPTPKGVAWGARLGQSAPVPTAAPPVSPVTGSPEEALDALYSVCLAQSDGDRGKAYQFFKTEAAQRGLLK